MREGALRPLFGYATAISFSAFALVASTIAFVLWYALATSWRPLSWAARAARAVTLMSCVSPSRRICFSCAVKLVACAICGSPVGCARNAHLKYITFLDCCGSFTSCYVAVSLPNAFAVRSVGCVLEF